MGTVLLSLLIGLIIGLFISIVQFIRVYRAKGYIARMVRLPDKEYRETLDLNRADVLGSPGFHVIGFPILCSLVSFVVTLIVIFLIN